MYKIQDIGIKNALMHILPQMVEAGELAKKLQGLITGTVSQGAMVKEGNRFGSVLTDADILVESIIGCYLYATFSDVSFYGEEAAHDRISAYFPKEAAYEVTLDPINGTLFYRDGLKIFDSILTIRQAGKFVAVADYIPHTGIFYLGVEGEGLFTTTGKDIEQGKPWQPYSLPQTPARVLFGKHGAIEQAQKLTAAGFTVIDLIEEYQPSPDWVLTINSILTGEICGYLRGFSHFIDWGALAWMVALGGGQWNDPIFDPATGKGQIIAASSPAVYAELMAVLPR